MANSSADPSTTNSPDSSSANSPAGSVPTDSSSAGGSGTHSPATPSAGVPSSGSDAVADAAARVFGDRLPAARRYVELLAEHGVERGLIGPREVDRLWSRHVLNSAVVGELMPTNCRVVDVGSGAGLPGIPLQLARPDLRLTLLEPMARRVAWLEEVVSELGLSTTVVRGRAEELTVRRRLRDFDVVTARAVAPLAKLAGWGLPLLRPGGMLLALKGASAAEEMARDAVAVAAVGGSRQELVSCGEGFVTEPTTVILVERGNAAQGRDTRRNSRKDR
ncbi:MULTISPECIES: 16S rRNA (guanine(527)-N(7))-methyltransferase RsmG [Actinoalloteichus]|uniref:Ribosomal RNA small subunit methyltransferase G n=1 Tax=Actinoalloteichus fjordicus TaxID=1612552 RepID=A0AAC9PUU4_9PSEU|nr:MULTISPECIES: 16S rRNA (guanine(527)-N(7))-methyltransferase RsmG [Actinoalloteichus]APU18049.1 16S rRNA (guanine(527)-N(7))-methyltransferase RsmG [Actinoalloteichus fjordicus]APU24128.1 16S rRNA (guanine(527)-N(7))-methyltransferase RsmG [Actinoalloteichus sp. GBA129-24]